MKDELKIAALFAVALVIWWAVIDIAYTRIYERVNGPAAKERRA